MRISCPTPRISARAGPAPRRRRRASRRRPSRFAWRRLRIDAEAEARRHRFARLTALEPHAATGAPVSSAARADAIRALFDHWAVSRHEKLALLYEVGVVALPPAPPDRAPAIRPAGEVARVRAEIAARVGLVAPAIVAMCQVPAAEDWQVWLTVAEVAEMMKVSPEDVESWIETGLMQTIDLPARDGTPTPRILPRHIARFRRILEARAWPEAPAPQGAAAAGEAPAGSAAGKSLDSAGPPPKLRPPRRGRHGRPAR